MFCGHILQTESSYILNYALILIFYKTDNKLIRINPVTKQRNIILIEKFKT